MSGNLIQASHEGSEDEVRRLIESGEDVNAVDWSGYTALHLASFNGHKDVVNHLLTAGASIHAVDEFGSTALHCASMYGHVDTVNLLLAAGANIHSVTKIGKTALHLASRGGRVDTVNLLLTAGANVHAVNEDGKTALDYAISSCHQDIVNVLRAYLAKVNVQSQHRVTTKHQASCSEPVAIVKPPVERDDNIGVLTQEMTQLNRGQIPEADLKTLRYFHVRMKRDLLPFPLIDHLYEKDVIDEDQLEIITITKEQRGRAASIGKMLEILKVCGNHAFQLFLECLEQEDVGYAVLASELKEHRYGGAQP